MPDWWFPVVSYPAFQAIGATLDPTIIISALGTAIAGLAGAYAVEIRGQRDEWRTTAKEANSENKAMRETVSKLSETIERQGDTISRVAQDVAEVKTATLAIAAEVKNMRDDIAPRTRRSG